MATYYVRNFGNDNNDGLTVKTAKKTIQGGLDVAVSSNDTVDIEGLFYENNVSGTANLNGNGNAIIDGRNSGYFTRNEFSQRSFAGLHFRNFTTNLSDDLFCNFNRCLFEDVKLDRTTGSSRSRLGSNTLIYNGTNRFFSCELNGDNATIFRAYIQIARTGVITDDNYLFAESAIEIQQYLVAERLRYSLFTNCEFKLTGGGLGTDEASFTALSGATDADKLANLRSRAAVVYGGFPPDYFQYCEVYDVRGNYNDIFIDADLKNFYLKEDSIAANFTFDGSYIGALPPAKVFQVADFDTLTNLQSGGLVTDQALDASLGNANKILDLGGVFEISKLDALRIIATRNGMHFSNNEVVSADISAGSGVLTDGEVYQVIGGSIALDDSGSTTYSVYETFTASDEGGGLGLGFSGTGVVRQVLVNGIIPVITIKISKSISDLVGIPEIKVKLSDNPKMNIDSEGEPLYGDADASFNSGTAVALAGRYVQGDLIQILADQIYSR